MKKNIILILVLMFVFVLSASVFAVEKTLIDFDKYEKRLISDGLYPNTQPASMQNRNSLERDRVTGVPIYKVSVSDMLVRRWLVELNSSASSVASKRYSYCRLVKTKGVYGGKPRNVLGARIHFHNMPYNAWAKIKPPFEIVAFSQDGKFVNVENGIIDNTGQLYQIVIEVNGRNYNNSISVRMKNSLDEYKDYFMGYLYFAGWKRLIWKNPNYIENVDLRQIFRLPLYPRSIPYKKFVCFIVMRQGDQIGGDFITYIAFTKVSYDKAVILEEMDIDDEQVWKIITQQQQSRAERDRRINTAIIDIRRSEALRQHNSSQIIQRRQQNAQRDIQGSGGNAPTGGNTARPAAGATGGGATGTRTAPTTPPGGTGGTTQ